MTPSFAPDVVQAICRHMNDDHSADSALIVSALGGLPMPRQCRAVDVNGEGMTFACTTEDGPVRTVVIPFATTAENRGAVRSAIVELYERACAVAGVTPRVH